MAEQSKQTVTECAEEEINLLDLLLVLAKRWRMIAYITLLSSLVSGAVVWSLPNRYQATAKVIALQRQLIQPLSASFVDKKTVTGFIKTPLQIASLPVLQEILQGRSLIQSLAMQFAFGPETQIKIKTTKGNIVEIAVEDADPKRAAAVANAAVGKLGRAAYALNLVSSPDITAERDSERLGDSVMTVIKLVEPASVPTHKVKPKRSQIVILSIVSAAFASVLLCFLLEAIANLKAKDRERWERIRSAVTGRH